MGILALRRDTKLDAGRQAGTHVIHHLDLICRQGRSVARHHIVTHLQHPSSKQPEISLAYVNVTLTFGLRCVCV